MKFLQTLIQEMDPDLEAGAYDREAKARDDLHAQAVSGEEEWNKLAHLLHATNVKNRPNAQHIGLAGTYSTISMDLPKDMAINNGHEREPSTVVLVLPRKFGADEKAVVKHLAKKSGETLHDLNFGTYRGNFEQGKWDAVRLGYYTSISGKRAASFKHMIIQLVEYFEGEL